MIQVTGWGHSNVLLYDKNELLLNEPESPKVLRMGKVSYVLKKFCPTDLTMICMGTLKK